MSIFCCNFAADFGDSRIRFETMDIDKFETIDIARDMAEDKWHWQENGTTWKGVGIYHLTMTVTDRRHLLGILDIPENNPQLAHVKRTRFGEQLVECLLKTPTLYPEVWIMSWCLMPNHIHAILRVKREMPVGIKTVVRSFWQGAKKLGREYSMSVSLDRIQHREETDTIRDNGHRHFDYDPVFHEMPFIRILSRHGQLDAMINYVKDNPQRLATMQLMPGYFHVQHNIEIGGRTYDAVGNAKLLMKAKRKEVHVRQIWVDDVERHGDANRLNTYVEECLQAAREGTIMVSPWISKYERQILRQLQHEGLPVIYLASNGFGDYFKPSRDLFEACKAGKVLILSPWIHDPEKKKVSRAECVALNEMAKEIVSL